MDGSHAVHVYPLERTMWGWYCANMTLTPESAADGADPIAVLAHLLIEQVIEDTPTSLPRSESA